jgi:hypothetical protein
MSGTAFIHLSCFKQYNVVSLICHSNFTFSALNERTYAPARLHFQPMFAYAAFNVCIPTTTLMFATFSCTFKEAIQCVRMDGLVPPHQEINPTRSMLVGWLSVPNSSAFHPLIGICGIAFLNSTINCSSGKRSSSRVLSINTSSFLL